MSSESHSKLQLSFYRKLYLAFLISQQPHNLLSLQKLSGMPRRTIQDSLKNIQDIGIEIQFIQDEGGRNNAGHYQLDNWGPIQPEWVEQHQANLASLLTTA